ncbi:MAG: hypothetical protein H7259_10630 [Cytophagales bacterium]|nr:hypothetical protein [Cytophaga sp.]
MKFTLFLFSCLLLSLTSVAQKGIPPLDSTGKDYGYYFAVPFPKSQTWDSTVFFTKKYLDSFFVDKWKMIKMDTAQQLMRVRLTSKLKSRGMLKNTHRSVYSNCYMTYDLIIHYAETGLTCKIKRIIHYYTLNEENPYMGSGKKSMVTKSAIVEVPMIQTDVKLYTKSVLQEVNKVISATILKYKTFKRVYIAPKKSAADED